MVKIETLRLADVGSTGYSQVHHALLLDLPYCLVDLTESLWDLRDRLHASIVCNDLIFNGCGPEVEFEQVTDKVLVHDDKFTR